MSAADARTAEEILSEMTRRIVEQFDPLQVTLFGSHARGARASPPEYNRTPRESWV